MKRARQIIRPMSARLTRSQFATGQKDYYLHLKLDDKRKLYACGSKYVTLDDVPTWPLYARVNGIKSGFSIFNNPQMRSGEPGELSPKLAIFRGDITTLEVDAIVNAANRQLAGGGGVLVFHDFDVPRILERTGVDGAIHRAAGGELKTESMSLAPCETGQAKITGGYKLPAKYVIHTVGPIGENASALADCYRNCMNTAVEHNLRTIAFPCISTGVYVYPVEAASIVALRTLHQWMTAENHHQMIDRIILCLFTDIEPYHRNLPKYFPV